MKELLELTNLELDNLDMAPIYNQFNNIPERQYLLSKSGVEHYRLLKWISDHAVPDTKIVELGAFQGLSTLCLASTPRVQVSAFDINTKAVQWKNKPANVSLIHISDMDTEHYPEEPLLQANIVFVDTWHTGKMERLIYDFLVENKWSGLLIYDDIYYGYPMVQMWNSIDHPSKHDLTKLGHSFGTGIIIF